MEDLATQAELEWAYTYDGYERLASSPEALWSVVAPVHEALLTTGRVPEWAGVDLLRGLAFYLVRADRHQGGGSLGRAWLELLDSIRAHPAAGLADLPPARTD
ncbi:hypothetical protein [Nocardioides sp. Kera G14]|uniref:hypothetical protein n=1 Tax=Nocardioides sp. Kera G14 TaxID=2884264 RepID=UPI001D0F9EBD|nr:hypothetical protein [Nocardioides sp. Kera G14]UDY24663.1 hypothetical protein LH076_04980 [Nocardioides sp. Kera G14]